MQKSLDLLTTSLTPELCCSNIKTSLCFYTHVLDFNIQYQREEEGFAMLEYQGARIMLDAIRTNTKTGTDRTWISGPLEVPFGRGVNFEIKTDKIDRLYERAQKSGATIFLPIEEKWYRIDSVEICNRQFIVLDPDGYMLRLSQTLSERCVKNTNPSQAQDDSSM